MLKQLRKTEEGMKDGSQIIFLIQVMSQILQHTYPHITHITHIPHITQIPTSSHDI